jgi:hypothetical protein
MSTTQVIVAFTGRKGHGKDAASMALPDDFKLLRFADPLKNMIRSLLHDLNVAGDLIERLVEGDLKERSLGVLGGKSTRYALQTLGTEWGRGLVSRNLWADTFKTRSAGHPRVKVTDVRFQDEVDAIHSLGGIVIRIYNPRRIDLSSTSLHDSETSIDALEVDRIIVNDGTLEELHDKVKKCLGLPYS